jgi:polyhydroxybutyrate depolymerase
VRRLLVSALVAAGAAAGVGVAGCTSTTTGTTGTPPTTVAARSAACTSPGRAGGPAGSGAQTIDVHGMARSFLVRDPAHRLRRPPPVLVELHGFGGSGASIGRLTGLPSLGAASGFVVVSPDGTGGTWQFTAHGSDADFLTALLRHLGRSQCIDPRRVYLAGFSAGAAFAIAYACGHPGAVTALATVAVDFQLGCHRPLPFLAFHGTADPAVPFANGAVGLSLPGIHVRGTELNMGDWARLDRCSTTPATTAVGPQVLRQQWGHCARGTKVVLYRIEGGGHTWPGADPALGVGLTTQEIDASRLMVAFFARHRPDAAATAR